jgi:hypothetical protein
MMTHTGLGSHEGHISRPPFSPVMHLWSPNSGRTSAHSCRREVPDDELDLETCRYSFASPPHRTGFLKLACPDPPTRVGPGSVR